jgi:hypothetical protein
MATPVWHRSHLGGDIKVLFSSPPVPCWYPGVKTLTLLGGGGAMGVVSLLEALLWDQWRCVLLISRGENPNFVGRRRHGRCVLAGGAALGSTGVCGICYVVWLAGGSVVVIFSRRLVGYCGLACRSPSGRPVCVLPGGLTPTSLGERGRVPYTGVSSVACSESRSS